MKTEQEERMGIDLSADAKERLRKYNEKTDADADLIAAVIFVIVILVLIATCIHVFKMGIPQP